MRRPSYRRAIRNARLLAVLASFDPHVVGRPPLGLDLPASDIDVLCHAPDPISFTSALWRAYADRRHFSIRQWIDRTRPVIASFEADGWRFELFGATRPVHQQDGWRHFDVERRLLRLGGAAFRRRVMDHRAQGLKTEPAFAAVLGLEGDPYLAMSALAGQPDASLAQALGASRRDLLHSKIGCSA